MSREPVKRPLPLKQINKAEDSSPSTILDLDMLKKKYPNGFIIINEIIIQYKLILTDPDFPFDLEYLHLEVLFLFSENSNVNLFPTFKVLNKDLPELFKKYPIAFIDLLIIFSKIEKAIHRILPITKPETRLRQVSAWLDKHLEALLGISTAKNTDDKIKFIPSSSTASSNTERRFQVEEPKAASAAASASSKTLDLAFKNLSLRQREMLKGSSNENIANDEISKLFISLLPFNQPLTTNLPSTQIKNTCTAIEFSAMEIVGISLFHFTFLSFSIMCGRCAGKGNSGCVTFTMLSPGVERTEICPSCKQHVILSWISEYCFPGSSSKIGYFSIMRNASKKTTLFTLNSSVLHFQCSNCDTWYKHSEFSCGSAFTIKCHTCHTNKISIAKVSDVFLTEPTSLTLKSSKKQQEEDSSLSYKPGCPLPEYGTCKHYRQSHRWLKFPCCGRAFPCDECHDETVKPLPNPHKSTWATRMICGFCAKEQPFSQKGCIYCKASHTKSSKAYWEGGKGVRDKTKMSRKDSHKYKGLTKANN